MLIGINVGASCVRECVRSCSPSQTVLLLGRLTAIVTGHHRKTLTTGTHNMQTSVYLQEYVPFYLTCL